MANSSTVLTFLGSTATTTATTAATSGATLAAEALASPSSATTALINAAATSGASTIASTSSLSSSLLASITPTSVKYGNAISTFTPTISTVFPSASSSAVAANATLAQQQSQQQQQAAAGPPYVLAQSLGGFPDSKGDLAACAVILLLFFAGAVAHAGLFIRNKKRNRFFPLAIGAAIFSIIRILTVGLRLGWSSQQTNGHLALAASVVVGAGTVILVIINLIMTQRLLRSQHPVFGDTRFFTGLSWLLLVVILLTTVLLVVAIVQVAYTLDIATRNIDRDIQLYGVTFMAIVAWLPLPIVAISYLIPHVPASSTMFGPKAYRKRLTIICLVAALLGFRNSWLSAASWQPPMPVTVPLEWYFSKPVFYLVALLPELLVVWILVLLRFDRWFYIGNLGEFSDPYSFASDQSRSESPPESLLPHTETEPKGPTGWDSTPESMAQYHYDTSQMDQYNVGQRPHHFGLSPVTEEHKSSMEAGGNQASPKSSTTSQASTANNSPSTPNPQEYPIPVLTESSVVFSNPRSSRGNPARLSRGQRLSVATEFPLPPTGFAPIPPSTALVPMEPRATDQRLSRMSVYSNSNALPYNPRMSRQSAYFGQDLGDPLSPGAAIPPLFSGPYVPSTQTYAASPQTYVPPATYEPQWVPASRVQVPVGYATPLAQVHVAPSAIYQQYQRQSMQSLSDMNAYPLPLDNAYQPMPSAMYQAPFGVTQQSVFNGVYPNSINTPYSAPLSSHPVHVYPMGSAAPYIATAPMFTTDPVISRPAQARLSQQPQVQPRRASVVTVNEHRSSFRASKSEAPVLGQLKHLSEIPQRRSGGSGGLFSFTSESANKAFRGSVEDWWNELKMEAGANRESSSQASEK